MRVRRTNCICGKWSKKKQEFIVIDAYMVFVNNNKKISKLIVQPTLTISTVYSLTYLDKVGYKVEKHYLDRLNGLSRMLVTNIN